MTAGFNASWKPGKNAKADGELEIKIAGTSLKFLLEVKRELRNHNLPKVLEQAAHLKTLMVVADRILPGIKEQLRHKHIAYLAPPLIVYADLMGTNDKRCIETAQMIYERYIEPHL